MNSLHTWYTENARELPWRKKRGGSDQDFYEVWISEVMLQQTQVVAVIDYYQNWMKRFPNVQALARAREESVLRQWSGLGYYSRARNIHRAANEVLRQGAFPRSREGWLALPGVGAYTVGAVLSIAAGRSEPVVDGNVERVFSRLRRIAHLDPKKRRLWRLAALALRRAQAQGAEPGAWNQALMELGARICTPRSPRCDSCPVSSICQAKAAGDPEAFPTPKVKKWKDVQEEVWCVWNDQAEVLLEKQEGKWRKGLWDFPLQLESLQKSQKQNLEEWGRVQSSHIVTRHRITRVTRLAKLKTGTQPIGRGNHCRTGSSPAISTSAHFTPTLRWVSWKDCQAGKTRLPHGSAFMKTIRSISERFPVGVKVRSKPEAG